MELLKNLVKIGLEEKQAKVYLACLQLGTSPVLAIAKDSGLKRPTVYLVLDDLEKMDLIEEVKKGKKTLYQAKSPDNIIANLSEKLTLAKNSLPTLKTIHNFDPQKPQIKIAEGVSGVRSIYNGIFTYLSHHPSEELIIFGALKDATENFQTSVIDYFYETMSNSHNSIREIGNDDTETRQYFRKSNRLNSAHEIRLIRDEGIFEQTDNMLYGNTLVIFSVKKEIFAIVIESKTIVNTYRTLFNMAWRSGKLI
ncbi:MAG: Transcriptional regulator, TrmB [Candidatus Magasanikbacteria bacterium GW2011_GWC2_37_14]|uniref:Transcriptional regulator, TrmB n=1 Tax=Candidatus Magasanikbacteria bacterium GW2011_GWC2_37_14 TaxID=1619046 RepID=A0A0G0GC14_9BACT|nr:MAG: Transcriptional regulator, TrmB [Candidatus Magasanikbacteria bacterium GW2011_GWC2_37_14]